MKTALIGCGNIAHTHLDVLTAQRREISALCDCEISRAEALQTQFHLPGAKLYSDYRQMFSETDADIVHICTPHDLHAPMILAALKAGKHVLCEKPVCLTESDYMRIQSVLQENPSLQFGVCFQNRYLEPVQELKKRLVNEKIKGANALVLWHRDLPYYRQDHWHGTIAHEGGGVMINQAIHTLDLMLWCLGTPKTVTATTANHHLKGQIEVEDTAEVYFEYGDGVHAQFYATTAAANDFPIRLMITTDQHTYEVCNGLWIDGMRTAYNEKLSICGKTCYGNGHYYLIEDFYRCLSEHRKFPVSLEEAFVAVKAILRIYASHGEEIKY